jgi:hypothetical protein
MNHLEDVTEFFDRKRRKDGLLLGLLSGLAFGLVSNGINALMVPGVTFFQPPFGLAGNTVMWTVIGGVLGITTAWAGGSIFGILVGSLIAGLMLQTSAFLGGNLRSNVLAKLVGLIGFYLPFAALAVPLLALIRVAANDQREWYDRPLLSWQRLRMPLILVLVFGGIGALWLSPPDGLAEIGHFNRMLRGALPAPTPAALPQPLQDPLVGDFLEKATPDYTVQFDRQNLDLYMIPYSPHGDYGPAAVVARFSNYWTLVCLYVAPDVDPFCRGYDDLERETSIGANENDIFTDHGFYVPNPNRSHLPTPKP